MEMDLTGSERAMRALKAFLIDDDAFQKAAPDVYTAFSNWQKKVFESEGRAATGSSWPEYSGAEKSYASWKRDNVGGDISLLRWATNNERLFPSLTRKGAEYNVARVTDTGWEWGTSLPYAHKHQRGVGRSTAWGKYPIPQRKFMNDDMNIPAIRSLVEEITRAMRDEGGI